jgi:hypothetical protein
MFGSEDPSTVDKATVWLSAAALFVSVVAYYFSRKSWQESNRPIVTARVRTDSGGNMGTALDLLVENTGSRPARDVRLTTDEAALAAAFASNINDTEREQIRACFSSKFIIPIIANGASVSNAFGFLSANSDNTWKLHSRIPIRVCYEDLDGRAYEHQVTLFVADNRGFASTHWASK